LLFLFKAVVIVLHLCQHIGSSFPPNPEPGSVTPWANNSTSPGNTQSTTFPTGGFIPNVRQPGPDPGRLPGDNNDDQAYYSTTGSSQAYGSTTMYFKSTESRSSISTESMSSKNSYTYMNNTQNHERPSKISSTSCKMWRTTFCKIYKKQLNISRIFIIFFKNSNWNMGIPLAILK
jgi:hypothetical protein